MATTQDHVQVEAVKNDVLILKDGGMAIILQTTAVNFGLLSENEQLAIISAFAALLNSLSFPIQIVIRSKRLDISSYLNLLGQYQTKQTNPLLGKMMGVYRQFIEKTVRENQVLDKKFYIVIPLSFLEIGLTKNTDETHFKKALTVLLPRRDHIIRQLWRTGLKATQLNTNQLINLFYDIYNPPRKSALVPQAQVSNLTEKPVPNTAQIPQQQVAPPQAKPEPQISQPQAQTQAQPPPQKPSDVRSSSLAAPFIVEELADDYSNIT